MQTETEVLADVCARLELAEVPYMLTGSMAMNYYAQPRMTRDIDIVIELSATDAENFVKHFTPDYYISPEAVKSSIAHESLFNLIHQETIIKIDFIIRKNQAYRKHEFGRRLKIQMEGFSAWIVSKEDLVVSKLFWAKDSASDLQLRDIKNLLSTGCDLDYIDHWTSQLELAGLWKSLRP